MIFKRHNDDNGWRVVEMPRCTVRMGVHGAHMVFTTICVCVDHRVLNEEPSTIAPQHTAQGQSQSIPKKRADRRVGIDKMSVGGNSPTFM